MQQRIGLARRRIAITRPDRAAARPRRGHTWRAVSRINRSIHRLDEGKSAFGELCRLHFPQPNPRATAIVVNERHAGLLEGPLDDLSGRSAGLTDAGFELVDGDNPNPGAFGQIVLGPSQ
jgi:hypothetical protein